MKKSTILILVFSIATAIITFYGIWIEPYWIEVRYLTIQNKALNKVLQGKTALQISDLHVLEIGKREHEVLKLTDEIKPDLIFLIGDYVRWDGDYEPALEFLSKLQAPLGVWAVMGDYDYSNSRKSCLFCHVPGSGRFTKRHRIHFLRNTSEILEQRNGSVAIAGIDENDGRFLDDTKHSFIKSDIPTIVLTHNPLSFSHVDEQRNILMLAGDTHGGQIPLPSWIWSVLGYQKTAEYEQGIFKAGCNTMIVSRGIGTSHLPVRFLRRPEIVVLHFN